LNLQTWNSIDSLLTSAATFVADEVTRQRCMASILNLQTWNSIDSLLTSAATFVADEVTRQFSARLPS